MLYSPSGAYESPGLSAPAHPLQFLSENQKAAAGADTSMWQAVNHTGSAELSNRKGCGHTHMLTGVTSTETLPSCRVRSILTPGAFLPQQL